MLSLSMQGENTTMALFQIMADAMRDKDADAFLAHVSDDFQFVRHQNGTVLNRDEMAEMMSRMMASGDWSVSDQRCLYENDDILVEHSIMSFPDGTREAVMAVNLKKDGKITRLETGATPLK